MEERSKFVGEVTEAPGEAIFIDGSRYRGTWDSVGMAGAGCYRMPHDVIFEGEIKDGMSHGQGTLEYPGKQRIDGVWNRGELKEWRYTFSDGLVYETNGWSYCQFPDRRFKRSKVSGLRPAGKSLKTQDQPTKVITSGSYDAGDGVFDPATACVTSFSQPSKIIRIPTAEERRWITQRCRKGGTQPTGYQPWLNENWSSDPPELPYRLAMSKDSPERWWKRISTFETDASVALEERRRAAVLRRSEEDLAPFYGSSDALAECVCGSQRGKEESDDGEATAAEVEVEVESVCGADRYSDETISGRDIFRKVVCQKMQSSSNEWEGEDSEDLLMTVCCPPEGTYAVTRRRRRRTSTGTLRTEDQSTEIGDERESLIYWEEKGGEEDGEEKEKEKGKREEYRDVLWDEIGWDKMCEKIWDGDEFSDSTFTDIEESMIGEEDSISYIGMVRDSEDIGKTESKLQPRKKPKSISGRAKKTKKGKRVRPKKPLKKRPCPPMINKEQLLQRKVGDLLFSPALEAPRSPVYLVKKTCDRKHCKKLKTITKYSRNSKCGASSSPANLPANNRGRSLRRSCTTGSSFDRNKICLSSKLFVTVPNGGRKLCEK